MDIGRCGTLGVMNSGVPQCARAGGVLPSIIAVNGGGIEDLSTADPFVRLLCAGRWGILTRLALGFLRLTDVPNSLP